MKIFQSTPKKQKGKIVGFDILIIDGQKQYSDTAKNFKLDSGIDINANILYNDEEGICVVGNEFAEYPNTEYNDYIDNIDAYMLAKEKREYVPAAEPTLKELKESKTQEAKVMFAQKRDAVRWIKVDDTNTYGFDCASEDITNFLAARTYLAAQVTKSAYTQYKVWLDESTKGIVELNLKQMDTVFTQVRASQFEAYAWLEEIQIQINNAETKEQLNEISLE